MTSMADILRDRIIDALEQCTERIRIEPYERLCELADEMIETAVDAHPLLRTTKATKQDYP